MKPLFTSKEYGVGGHNKLQVDVFGKDVQIWIKDGDVNAIICMDKSDLDGLKKALTKAVKAAPEKVAEGRDYTKPIRKKVLTTSEENGIKKKRKTRSDKGKKRGPKK